MSELALARRQLASNSATLAEQQGKMDQEAGVRRQVLAMAGNLEGNMAVSYGLFLSCFARAVCLRFCVVFSPFAYSCLIAHFCCLI